ncbi:hypothetical protein EAG18_20565 [Pseudoalteromonas sp. J010]|uniref:hypothetical protein n=1 Tax=Pseudoalteromonas sp. J010 TaxID=998465 RepID=UPI000F64D53E|nr:hypothetical protein [Pseudoalteromonas sp. J010]RRS06767.1 hypothetical protein EAG18_20565 [Pseudoalteromonas sp. J010]
MASLSLALPILLSLGVEGNLNIVRPSETFYYLMEDGVVLELPVKLGDRVEEGELILKYNSAKTSLVKEIDAKSPGYIDFKIDPPGSAVIPAGTLMVKVKSPKVFASFYTSHAKNHTVGSSLWFCNKTKNIKFTVSDIYNDSLLVSFDWPMSDIKVDELLPSNVTLHNDEGFCNRK